MTHLCVPTLAWRACLPREREKTIIRGGVYNYIHVCPNTCMASLFASRHHSAGHDFTTSVSSCKMLPMCECVYIYTHTHTHTHAHTHTYTHIHTLYTHTHTHYTHTHTHTYIHTYIHTYVYTYIHLYRRVCPPSQPCRGGWRHVCTEHILPV